MATPSTTDQTGSTAPSWPPAPSTASTLQPSPTPTPTSRAVTPPSRPNSSTSRASGARPLHRRDHHLPALLQLRPQEPLPWQSRPCRHPHRARHQNRPPRTSAPSHHPIHQRGQDLSGPPARSGYHEGGAGKLSRGNGRARTSACASGGCMKPMKGSTVAHGSASNFTRSGSRAVVTAWPD